MQELPENANAEDAEMTDTQTEITDAMLAEVVEGAKRCGHCGVSGYAIPGIDWAPNAPDYAHNIEDAMRLEKAALAKMNADPGPMLASFKLEHEPRRAGAWSVTFSWQETARKSPVFCRHTRECVAIRDAVRELVRRGDIK